ncbi:hypothetical protein [Actinocorallia longicatena]|uniref:Uncharacterized protein n=1 Tax=Actinocorallia longicatena TaxID=111803 RepID=A0ABP6QBS6_9ACTN
MSENYANTIGQRLEQELEEEFPGWLIAQEASGRRTATRTGWGSLYGQTAGELRRRLRTHGREIFDG